MASDPNAPINIGNIAGRMTPDVGAELTTSLYGMDTLTRPFTCLTSEMWKFTPKKYAPDSEYPKMYYIETRVLYREGLLTRAELVYTGKAKGLPDAEIQDSKKLKSAAIPFVFGAIGFDPVQLDFSIQYLGPCTSFSWITDRKPGEKPPDKYARPRSSVSPFSEQSVLRIKITDQNGATQIIPPASIDKVFKEKGTIILIEDYVVDELVPGYYWKCTSVVTRIIDPVMTSFVVNEG